MSIAPFHPAPARARGEARRTRIALIAASVGIAAAILAYAISPGVRHAVGHAAHSVKHTVSSMFDHDHAAKGKHAAGNGKHARKKARGKPNGGGRHVTRRAAGRHGGDGASATDGRTGLNASRQGAGGERAPPR